MKKNLTQNSSILVCLSVLQQVLITTHVDTQPELQNWIHGHPSKQAS